MRAEGSGLSACDPDFTWADADGKREGKGTIWHKKDMFLGSNFAKKILF